MRVVLTEEDFRDLVRGKSIKSRDLVRGGTMDIILEDIGWDRMSAAIYDARMVGGEHWPKEERGGAST